MIVRKEELNLPRIFLESFGHESDKQATVLAVASHRKKIKITKVKSDVSF